MKKHCGYVPQLDLLWFFFVVYFVFTTQRTPPICALQTSHDHCLPVTFMSLLYYFLLFTFFEVAEKWLCEECRGKKENCKCFCWFNKMTNNVFFLIR